MGGARTLSREKQLRRFNDPAQTIRVAVGETFVLALAGNPTTGYFWETDVDDCCLQLFGQEFEPRGAGVGAGGQELFHFRALETGETEITCTYRRPWEVETRETRRFRVVIA